MTTQITQTLQSSGMAVTQSVLVQTRTAVVVDGTPKFRVNNYMNATGLLPDTGVFLVEIVDPDDGSRDALQRVTQVADIFEYPSHRTTAVNAGLTYYRSPAWTSVYEDLYTAQSAAKTFADRVNQLVQDWVAYQYDFAAGPPGDFIYLPSADTSALAALITSWETARVATLTAQSTLEVAKRDVDAADAARAAAYDKQQLAESLNSTLQSLSNQSTVLGSVLGNLREARNRLGNEPVAFPDTVGEGGSGFWQSLNDLVRIFDDNKGVLPSAALVVRDMFVSAAVPELEEIQDLAFGITGLGAAQAAYEDRTTSVVAAAAQVTAAADALTVAKQALGDAERALVLAQADYDTAVQVQDNALNAVKKACPLFDPANPTALLVR